MTHLTYSRFLEHEVQPLVQLVFGTAAQSYPAPSVGLADLLLADLAADMNGEIQMLLVVPTSQDLGLIMCLVLQKSKPLDMYMMVDSCGEMLVFLTSIDQASDCCKLLLITCLRIGMAAG